MGQRPVILRLRAEGSPAGASSGEGEHRAAIGGTDSACRSESGPEKEEEARLLRGRLFKGDDSNQPQQQNPNQNPQP